MPERPHGGEQAPMPPALRAGVRRFRGARRQACMHARARRASFLQSACCPGLGSVTRGALGASSTGGSRRGALGRPRHAGVRNQRVEGRSNRDTGGSRERARSKSFVTTTP